MHKGSFSPHLHQNLLFIRGPFDDSHHDGCEVILHCAFDLHFPDEY